MNLRLKHFFLIATLLTSALAWGQGLDTLRLFDYIKGGEYELGDIRVEGARFLDPKILITLTGLTKGDKIKIPGEQLTKAVKALWKQKLFTNVSIVADRIRDGKIYLVIYVEERPRISRYSFKGIKTSDADDIKKKIDLRAGNIFTENMRSLTINAIKNYYIDKGFLSVKVTIQELKDTLLANSVLLRIIVDKGDKVQIAQINFYGNKIYSEKTLRNQMKETHEKPQFDAFGFFKFRRNFHADSLYPKWYQLLGNISPLAWWEYWNRHTHVNLNIFQGSKLKKDDYEDDKNHVVELLQ